MNEPQLNESDAGTTAGRQQGSDPRQRPRYNAGSSESTRELRDTSRRRRDAEEKLQQHLLEAKEHVPHHYDHDGDTPDDHDGNTPENHDGPKRTDDAG